MRSQFEVIAAPDLRLLLPNSGRQLLYLIATNTLFDTRLNIQVASLRLLAFECTQATPSSTARQRQEWVWLTLQLALHTFYICTLYGPEDVVRLTYQGRAYSKQQFSCHTNRINGLATPMASKEVAM